MFFFKIKLPVVGSIYNFSRNLRLVQLVQQPSCRYSYWLCF